MPTVQKHGSQVAARFGETGMASAFVSYSHHDWKDFAEEFRRQLTQVLDSRPDLSLRSHEVYWERDHVRAGDDWDDRITGDLAKATDFIFLASSRSLESKYCVNRELLFARRSGLRIIPVILSGCKWDTLEHPEFPGEPLLGPKAAVPKDTKFNLLPIAQWQSRDEAMLVAAEQVAEAFAAPSATSPSSPFSRAAMPRTLPFLCNQKRVETDIIRGLRHWQGQALLLLLKGRTEDRGPGFWDRLVARELKDYVEKRLQLQLREARPLGWLDPDGDQRSPEVFRDEMLIALSTAITQDPYEIDSVERLADALRRSERVLPLFATLPKSKPAWAGATIQALRELLEACPEGTPLNRLAIGLSVEDPSLLESANLCERMAIQPSPSLRVVEPSALSEIDSEDVRIWHRNNPVSRYTRLDEEQLVNAIFESPGTLPFVGLETQLRKLHAL